MPFATVAVPFDAYRDLPTPQHRWLMLCLARYADREGRCWPSIRQLAADARMSKSAVQRYLADLSHLGIFSRSRRPGGRYVYRIEAGYQPRYPQRRATVPTVRQAVPQRARQEAFTIKHQEISDDSRKWESRMRSWSTSRFWLPFWGPKPSEPGCWAPRSTRSSQ